MPRCVFQVVFYKVTDFCFLELLAFLALTTNFESNPVNLKVRYLR